MTRSIHHEAKYGNQGKGNFNLAYHLEMVSDQERVSLFKKGIDNAVTEGTIFCEIGCGTGIFAIHAAKKAKKVYAIEYDENIMEILERNIKKSGLSDKIDIIYDDGLSVQLPEKADVAFCEMLSIWLIEEPEVLAMNHVQNKLLKPDGITIPEKVINLAELCNYDYIFDNIEMKSSIAQFTGIKPPRVMSESRVFNTISFDRENPREIAGSIEFTALTSGMVNSVRLSSIIRIQEGVNFYSTDSLMPHTIVPLKKQLYVKEGQKVWFTAQYKHRESIDNAFFEIK